MLNRKWCCFTASMMSSSFSGIRIVYVPLLILCGTLVIFKIPNSRLLTNGMVSKKFSLLLL